MQVLQKRGEIIQWAGANHAFPVLRGDGPELRRAGDTEPDAHRVGWKEFFSALREKNLLVVVDAPGASEHKLLTRHKAHAELPPEAFGPPLWQRVWHEITLGPVKSS